MPSLHVVDTRWIEPSSPTALTRLRSPRMKLAEVLRDEDSDSAIERPTFVGEIFL